MNRAADQYPKMLAPDLLAVPLWKLGINCKVIVLNPAKAVPEIETLMEGLVKDPFSRRYIVNAWNVAQINDMALPPCHTMFQFHATPDADGKPWRLNCSSTSAPATCSWTFRSTSPPTRS